jgi:hypothetical protein
LTVRAQILEFLRDPGTFSSGASDPEIWLAGLQFAEDSILAKNDYSLRPAQSDAWRGLANSRAGLVLGPPGTGKTHLLSWLILGYIKARADAGLPCRVLVSAFTLNAIGNLLSATVKRRDEHWLGGPSIHFFGNPPSAPLDNRILHRTRLYGAQIKDAFEDLEQPNVIVGASVWSLYRLLDSQRGPEAQGLTAGLFDLVCIDEASQLVLGHSLLAMGGLKVGGRLIVAGDECQLPPIRASREIKLGDRQLGGSLYTFLKSGSVPEFALDETFRLNAPLAAFPERHFYPDRYRSAVEAAKLELKEGWEQGLTELEQTALDPRWPICILVHDGPPSASSNPFEARLTGRLATVLAERLPNAKNADGEWNADLWTEHLAIISPHRAQNALIREGLPTDLRRQAFVETIDRIQGKERDAILLSYCVADAEFALAEGEFIFSSERLNVAITRARTKLIVVVSRRLLDAVPSDQEVMDKAELLREFVFSATKKGEAIVSGPEGQDIRLQVRVLGFGDEAILEDLVPELSPPATETIEMSSQLESLLQAVRDVALADSHGTAKIRDLQRRLARADDLISDLRSLHQLGYLSLSQISGPYGAFWVAKPIEPKRRVFGADANSVRLRIEDAILGARRGPFAPYYAQVRDRFVWMDPQGADVLRPLLTPLEEEGLIKFATHKTHQTIDFVESDAIQDSTEEPLECVELSDDDFRILNALEDVEVRRINFGVFEAWTSVAGLAAESKWSRDHIASSIGRLNANGWLMIALDGRIRTRMGELAREVRHVKQRFVPNDADRRPYLVRSLKVEVRNRDKPDRDVVLADAFDQAAISQPSMKDALSGLRSALTTLWGNDAKIAGFQKRGLDAILSGWQGEDHATVVIAADTGSGKTEAACMPLIVAAAADRLAGIDGVRSVLTYPRVRLAANQAQRLSGYLAALAQQPGMPTLTLGLQVGAVPNSLASLIGPELQKDGWNAIGSNEYTFPFFGCPSCGNDLTMQTGAGFEKLDRLNCNSCRWHFDGWVGTKQGLTIRPPNFFLPTTDSLHQWLHNVRYGSLFGDNPKFAPPRAVLADEIHLYSHVHGAQVGLAFRRLIARAEINSSAKLPTLAIGMSATLGDPAAAWGDLINRDNVTTISPTDAEKTPNPRGREYFYFVQPEVESRGQDIAGASTTIQSLMCLAHGMRRRTGEQGGYRSLAFLDSIDKVRRLHAAYQDAEENLRLASLRTRRFGDDPATGQPIDECCGEAVGCDRFRSGECWWFGANDQSQIAARGRLKPGRPLKVSDQPIFSGTGGKVENIIKTSDVVFSTSSLEVGYDDPDITLVYQHYAPQNLASFIQRKGRGGRGADDRPITGITLSIYSPRDSWWFRKPHEMIEPAGFSSPLNPNNHFVRRGQLLACVLDAMVRHECKGGTVWRSDGLPTTEAFSAAETFVTLVFGHEPWKEFDDCKSLAELWARATSHAPQPLPREFPKLRETITWIPNFLFEAVNLPLISVSTNEDRVDHRPRREDIALVLASSAPGNATRRYDSVAVHWRPPLQGLGPWLDRADYAIGQRPQPYKTEAELLSQLPQEVRETLTNLSPIIFRPRTVKLETLGRAHGTGWQSDWIATAGTSPEVTRRAETGLDNRRIKNDSRGSLRGFPIVKLNAEKGRPLPITPIKQWIERADYFVGQSLGGKETGIALARVYWGADSEIKLSGRDEEPVVFSQTFTGPDDKRPLLHGFHVQTEGIRLAVDKARLDNFVTSESERISRNDPERRWYSAQMLRYLVESQAQAVGVNSYEARRGAELMVSAAGDPDLRRRLTGIIKYWDGAALAALFEDARAQFLSQHPLLSQRRVARVAGTLASQTFQPIFNSAISAISDPIRFSNYLRSTIIHSLGIRLKQSFVHVGKGDERQVFFHAKLPIQFPESDDYGITICEAGSYGDGTTRAYIEHFSESVEHWSDGFISGCPNAEEDALVQKLWTLHAEHSAWRAMDPNHPAHLIEIGRSLGQSQSSAAPPSIVRILFGSEIVGSERFEIYTLAQQIHNLDNELAHKLGRAPSAWELTSVVVEHARTNRNSYAGRLLTAFERLEDAVQHDSLSAESRLADQVYRLSARLCVDGCQACVHQPSDIMSDSLVESSTSRGMLRRFIEH